MIYSREVEEMCPVAQGVHHGAAPIPEEAKWVQAKEVKDISGFEKIDGHLYQGILDTVIRSGSITVSSTGDVSTADDTLYVRCGNYIFSVGRNGIRKSTNGGSTWVDL